MRPAIELTNKINSEAITIGVLGTDHVWPRLVELCINAGLDYLIVDREHGPHDDSLVAHVCQAGRLANFPIILRVVGTEYDQLRRAVDLGPCGLMIPCVESADDLDRVRDAVFMPPRGRRRPGGWGNHWMRNFNYATWREEFEDHLIVLPQIESKRGLEDVDAIAGHELTTAIAVGPYDLSAELGCCWEPENPALLAAFDRIRDAGRKAGKNMWMGMGGRTLVDRGYTFVCLGDPSALLQGTLGEMATAARA